MKRREFLKAAALGAAASAVAMPAVAQLLPEIKWRLTSSFPKALDALWGAADDMSRFVSEATSQRFQIQTFAAGEIVPGLQALDAVSNGTVEMCHTAAYYFVGKDPTFALFCAVPFGLNARQQNAWFADGDGQKLFVEFGQKYNIYPLVGGNTGAQMGGWFRKELKTPQDFVGLKFRTGAFAGRTIQKFGGVPQLLAGGDIYPALEKGTIDAAEWVGPYDDEKLGFYKVAKYYYYPSWWEGGTALHFFINTSKWAELPKNYQAIVTTAADRANLKMQAKYDARNPNALKRLISTGAVLESFSAAIMDAALKFAKEVYADTSAANPDFKKVYESMISFRGEQYLWWQVAEYHYDTFMIRNRTIL
jgi:TRAP-type mannitol/chloroaromatic compound transport system substrate-binding protein